MPFSLIPGETPIRIHDLSSGLRAPDILTTWGEFVKDNDDDGGGFCEDLAADLAGSGRAHFGGGATPFGVVELFGLCPVCGEGVSVSGWTKDGRMIGSCMDAFTREAWEEIES
uniref:Uncharacterized protein n=1 Tax=viral metagenome TaxID=1070528 RepID=A0A6H2A1J1_9ZZZZ